MSPPPPRQSWADRMPPAASQVNEDDDGFGPLLHTTALQIRSDRQPPAAAPQESTHRGSGQDMPAIRAVAYRPHTQPLRPISAQLPGGASYTPQNAPAPPQRSSAVPTGHALPARPSPLDSGPALTPQNLEGQDDIALAERIQLMREPAPRSLVPRVSGERRQEGDASFIQGPPRHADLSGTGQPPPVPYSTRPGAAALPGRLDLHDGHAQASSVLPPTNKYQSATFSNAPGAHEPSFAAYPAKERRATQPSALTRQVDRLRPLLSDRDAPARVARSAHIEPVNDDLVHLASGVGSSVLPTVLTSTRTSARARPSDEESIIDDSTDIVPRVGALSLTSPVTSRHVADTPRLIDTSSFEAGQASYLDLQHQFAAVSSVSAIASEPPFAPASGHSIVSQTTAAWPRAPPPPPQTQVAPSVAGTTATATQRRTQAKLLSSFYVKPGYGSRGRPVEVLSNYFQVRSMTGRGKLIHHYDVDINPVINVLGQKKPKGLLRAVWEQLCLDQTEGIPSIARRVKYVPSTEEGMSSLPWQCPSRKTIVTAIAPDGLVQRPSVRDATSSDDNVRRWKVAIKHVNTIDLEVVMQYCKADEHVPRDEEGMLTAVMCTNVLMRDIPSKKFTQVGATGNKFFTFDGAQPISHGGIVCKGFTQSFRYASAGLPALNIDVAFSAFLAPGPALNVMAKILDRERHGGGARGSQVGTGGYLGSGPPGALPDLRELRKEDIELIKNKLRGAKFTVTHRASTRLHTIMPITALPASDITFTLNERDGLGERRLSIPEYYKQYYGVEVTKPRLPCVQYGKKSFVPLEFVRLAEWNPLPPTSLNAQQTTDMIKMAAMRPRDRSLDIQNWRKVLDYDSQPKIAAWGLQVNKQMVKIAARLLPPPKVLYAENRAAKPREGGWDLRGMRFFREGLQPLVSWAFVSFDRWVDINEMRRYCDFLCRTLEVHGQPVANKNPPMIPPVDPRKGVLNSLQEAARQAYMAGGRDPQLICVVLPGRDAWLYESIKKASFLDLKKPVPTQCMQAAKIKNPQGIAAYTGNLVTKIQPPIKPGLELAPTVSCSIATYNATCDAYSAQIRLQEGREEIVRDLQSMITAHLQLFHQHNGGTFPERILVFRDGVSEGQYAASTAYDLQAITAACAALQPGYRPQILVCICAKQHQTRFFGREADVDHAGNLPAGLVVDKTVTHPFAYDFFLQSHASRIGTARPTHYVCLVDELGPIPDELQRLVHGLCFGFARCTRSVSLVPVCYLADLVCQKARIMIHEPSNTSYAPSESSAGRITSGAQGQGPAQGPGTATGTGKGGRARRAVDIEAMQLQKVLMKNPELERVMWWM